MKVVSSVLWVVLCTAVWYHTSHSAWSWDGWSPDQTLALPWECTLGLSLEIASSAFWTDQKWLPQESSLLFFGLSYCLQTLVSWIKYMTVDTDCCNNKFHVHQCQAQKTYTWVPDHYLTFPWPLPSLNKKIWNFTWPSPKLHLTFTLPSPDHLTIVLYSPEPYLTLT